VINQTRNWALSVRIAVRGLALQWDVNGPIGAEKIIAVGFAGNPNRGKPYDFALARFSLDGALDAAFGSGGLVTTGDHDVANAVALQSDGKIVVAGGTSPGDESSAFGLARYDRDGSLDPHFGDGGIVRTKFPASLDPQTNAPGDVLAEAFAVAVRDGKIVAFGDQFVDGPTPYDGVAIQKDDKIVGVGSIFPRNIEGSDFGLVRYLASRVPGTF
jgi:uncharacterized delta-60 repeat protein